jgi:hypothetical protein
MLRLVPSARTFLAKIHKLRYKLTIAPGRRRSGKLSLNPVLTTMGDKTNTPPGAAFFVS